MVKKQKNESRQNEASRMKKNADIFAAFFRVGILGFGGGPSSIPLFQREVVDNYQWMDKDEFGDTLALSNTMPGPIVTKLAGYVGYRVNGLVGCLIAIFASVVPTVLLMILLLGVLQQYKDVEWVNHMSAAVVPVVAVMLGVMTWDFLKKSGEALGWARALLLVVFAAILMEGLNVHPAILIVALLAIVLLPRSKGGERK